MKTLRIVLGALVNLGGLAILAHQLGDFAH